MGDEQVTPLSHGISTVDEETFEMDWTSPIGQEMVDLGYRMVKAEVDESGYFLTVRFENINLNHVRSARTGVPLCKQTGADLVTLDHDDKKHLCPKCEKLVEEGPHFV